MFNKKSLSDIKGKAESTFDSAVERGAKASATFKKSETGAAILRGAKEAQQKINKSAEDTGAKDAYHAVTGKVSDTFDTLSGEKVMRELQRRLDGQDQLNDVLASKLHEALQRIDALEKALQIRKRGT